MTSELRHLITTFSILEKRDKRTLILITVAQSFLSVLDLVGIALLGIIGSLVVSGVSIREPSGVPAQVIQMFGIEEQRIQIQTAVLGTIAGITLIGKSLLSLWFSRKAILFLARLSAQLSYRLTNSLVGNDLQSRGMQDAHGSVYAVTSGVNALTTGLLGSAISMTADFSVLFAMFITLSIVDFNLAVISLVMFSCVGIVLNRLLSRKAKELGARQSELSVSINRSLLDVIAAFREFFVRGTLRIRVQEIGGLQSELARNQATLSFMPSIGKYLLEVLMIFGIFVIAGYQFLSKSSEDAVAAITIFLAASSRLGPAVLRIQHSLVQIRNSTALAGQTLKLIDELPQKHVDFFEQERVGLQSKVFIPEIEVSDLYLTYKNSGTKAVKGVSVKVSAGEMLAIVGKSGSGKTSFVDALLGLIYPDSGSILISGISPRKAIEAWSGKIAYVPQVPILRNASIRENILLGLDQDSFDDDSIWNVLDLAGLKSEISRLDEQLDFVVGDAGSRLSGGQRQRLGIARALLTRPKLLVLDEATSSLDSLTEKNLGDSLRGLRGDVTLIVIAHRLSTIRDADLIMYLEGGKSTFQGTFDEARKYINDFEEQIKLQTF